MASLNQSNLWNVQKILVSASLIFGQLLLQAEAQGFDFFYFVQQWPGSFCDTTRSCCYPLTGKPAADFSIHGLWPNNKDGSYPSKCNPGDSFDSSKISDLRNELNAHWPSLACPSSNDNSFWKHEWAKHGTCAETVIVNEHDYFQAALSLRGSIDLLGALQRAGIQADNGSYSSTKIEKAVAQYLGHTAGMQCNTAADGQIQLFQIYVCVAAVDASTVIDCPMLPSSGCTSQIVFPSF